MNLEWWHQIVLTGNMYILLMWTVHSVLKLKIKKGVCTDLVVVRAHWLFPGYYFLRCIINLRLSSFFCLTAVSESLDELMSAVAYRLGMDNEKSSINLLVRGGLCPWKHTLLIGQDVDLQHLWYNLLVKKQLLTWTWSVCFSSFSLNSCR